MLGLRLYVMKNTRTRGMKTDFKDRYSLNTRFSPPNLPNPLVVLDVGVYGAFMRGC